MTDLHEVELDRCYICSAKLVNNPLYPEAVSKYCPRDGDYFIQRFLGREPVVIFRPFDVEETIVEKDPDPDPDPIALPVPRRIIPTLEDGVRLNRWTVARAGIRAGHPGYILRCNETRRVFSSVKKAAEIMGLSKTALSRHLNGKQDDVAGYTFAKMGHNIGYL
jgi:hypothetical protein